MNSDKIINTGSTDKDYGSFSGGMMFLVDKPMGYTSARVVGIIKKKLNVKKAGHSGTLDPKATGLLIVCTDKLTKKLNTLLDAEKEYTGIVTLGARTASFDSETKFEEERDYKSVTREQIVDAIKSFTGKIEQMPPMYSALKHKGKALYKYARKGEEIERKTRTIEIKEFEILKIDLPDIYFRIRCSKGTYIRSIANDLGEKLSTLGYLKELRRTKIGEYSINDSVQLENINSPV